MSDSLTISRLRIPLALCIIMIHLHMGVSGQQIGWGCLVPMDGWRLFACVMVNEVAAIAVPLFFMISGYLFFVKFDRSAFFGKLRRRVRSLLVPYVVFNLLAAAFLVINYAQNGHTLSQGLHTYLGDGRWMHILWDSHTTGHNVNLLGISKPVSYPVNIPLWFIRDLMVLMLMAPLVYWAVRRLHWAWVLVMVALSLTGIWIPLVGFSPTSCLYFSIGALFSIKGRCMGSAFGRCSRPLLLAALPLMGLDILADGTAADRYIHFAFLLIAVPATYGLVNRTSKGKHKSSVLSRRSHGSLLRSRADDATSNFHFSTFNSRLSAPLSFFIFAFHTLPLPLLGQRPVEWAKHLLWTDSQSALLCIAQFLGTIILTATMCVAVYFLLYLLCPKFLAVLVGRAPKRT